MQLPRTAKSRNQESRFPQTQVLSHHPDFHRLPLPVASRSTNFPADQCRSESDTDLLVVEAPVRLEGYFHLSLVTVPQNLLEGCSHHEVADPSSVDFLPTNHQSLPHPCLLGLFQLPRAVSRGLEQQQVKERLPLSRNQRRLDSTERIEATERATSVPVPPEEKQGKRNIFAALPLTTVTSEWEKPSLLPDDTDLPAVPEAGEAWEWKLSTVHPIRNSMPWQDS